MNTRFVLCRYRVTPNYEGKPRSFNSSVPDILLSGVPFRVVFVLVNDWNPIPPNRRRNEYFQRSLPTRVRMVMSLNRRPSLSWLWVRTRTNPIFMTPKMKQIIKIGGNPINSTNSHNSYRILRILPWFQLCVGTRLKVHIQIWSKFIP